MGMYTELHFNCELKKELPSLVTNILQYMVGENDHRPLPPDHPLFQASRWAYMLRMDSFYFNADTHSTLRFCEISNAFYLCIRCNLKNYDSEIEHFLHWIHPFLNSSLNSFLGFLRYEEDDIPTLLFFTEVGIQRITPVIGTKDQNDP